MSLSLLQAQARAKKSASSTDGGADGKKDEEDVEPTPVVGNFVCLTPTTFVRFSSPSGRARVPDPYAYGVVVRVDDDVPFPKQGPKQYFPKDPETDEERAKYEPATRAPVVHVLWCNSMYSQHVWRKEQSNTGSSAQRKAKFFPLAVVSSHSDLVTHQSQYSYFVNRSEPGGVVQLNVRSCLLKVMWRVWNAMNGVEGASKESKESAGRPCAALPLAPSLPPS